MTKTNYDQFDNFKGIEKKIEKSSVNLIAAFHHKVHEINYNTKVHPLNFEKVFN